MTSHAARPSRLSTIARAIATTAIATAANVHSSDAQSPAAARRPDTTRIEKLVGCYRLTLGPWSQATRLGPPSQTKIIRLDSAMIPRSLPGARVAARVAPVDMLPPTDPRARWLQPALWRLIGSDSLEIITWSTGTEAESFDGHAAGGELRGVLRRTSDAIPTDPKTGRIMWDALPWARASARRVPCP